MTTTLNEQRNATTGVTIDARPPLVQRPHGVTLETPEPIEPLRVAPSRSQSKAAKRGPKTDLTPTSNGKRGELDYSGLWNDSAREVANKKSKGRVFAVCMAKCRSALGLDKKAFLPFSTIQGIKSAEQAWNQASILLHHEGGRNLKRSSRAKVAKDVETNVDGFVQWRQSATEHKYATVTEEIQAGADLKDKSVKRLKSLLASELPPTQDERDETRNKALALIKSLERINLVLDRLTGKRTPRNRLTGWVAEEQDKFLALAAGKGKGKANVTIAAKSPLTTKQVMAGKGKRKTLHKK